MYCANTVLAGGVSPHAIANDKQKEINNKTDIQPVDDLKARKLAILLDK